MKECTNSHVQTPDPVEYAKDLAKKDILKKKKLIKDDLTGTIYVDIIV